MPLALLIIPPLVGVLLGLLYQVLTSNRLSRVYAILGSALTFLLTFMVSAKPYWQKFKQGLSLLEEKNREIDEERRRRITELENEVSVLTKQYMDAEREAETIHRQVVEIERDIAGTNASKMLAEFIEDRAACSDYRRHLGVLALIRRDFEQLAALFSEQRKDERSGKGADDVKTINRIILYIDDLDRCPPDRVVQVLQAIHLLLAFPLFVVVVGVDARWVTRSLRESYEWLRDEAVNDMGESKVSIDNSQGASPHDYLEKIFQIPFWLKPMEDEVCKKFIEGLTKDSRVRVGEEQENGIYAEDGVVQESNKVTLDDSSQRQLQGMSSQATVSHQDIGSGPILYDSEETQTEDTRVSASEQEIVGDSRASADEGIAAADIVDKEDNVQPLLGSDDAGDEEIDLEPQRLKLTDEEIAYMKKLTPLIGRSPRAVKRFLNCYRLIRVGLPASELATFIGNNGQGGVYRAVMILLGIITGAPSISLYFIGELEVSPKTSKDASLHTLLARLNGDEKVNRYEDWIRMRGFLENHISESDSTDMLKALITVAPRVSRYSFRVARVGEAQSL